MLLEDAFVNMIDTYSYEVSAVEYRGDLFFGNW